MDKRRAIDKSEIAVVFIHGIGVQDRFQQLSQFADGIEDHTANYRGCLTRDGEDKEPLGAFEVFSVKSKEGKDSQNVHIYEVYWGPLLNGFIGPVGVVRWMVATLARTAPKLLPRIVGGTVKQMLPLRWLGAAISGLIVIALAALLVFTFVGIFLMASERLVALHEYSKTYHVSDTGTVYGRDAEFLEGKDHLALSPYVDYVSFVRDAPSKGRITMFSSKEALARRSKFLTGELAQARPEVIRRQPGYGIDYYQRNGFIYPYRAVWSAITSLDSMRVLGSFADLLIKIWSFKVVLGILALLWGRRRIDPRPGQGNIYVNLLPALPPILALIAFRYFGMETDLLLQHLLTSCLVLYYGYKGVKFVLNELLGDVAIYASRNENARQFQARSAVLDLACAAIEKLLANERYGRIIIVGHSLGSVIAVDSIRRLYTRHLREEDKETAKATLRKLSAFISMGSPLEKTRTLFNVADHKSRHYEFCHEVDTRIFGVSKDPNVRRIPWFNFWFDLDIIADPLRNYPVSPNHDYRLGLGSMPWCHSDYWFDPVFVDAFWEIVLSPNPGELSINTRDPAKSPPQS